MSRACRDGPEVTYQEHRAYQRQGDPKSMYQEYIAYHQAYQGGPESTYQAHRAHHGGSEVRISSIST